MAFYFHSHLPAVRQISLKEVAPPPPSSSPVPVRRGSGSSSSSRISFCFDMQMVLKFRASLQMKLPKSFCLANLPGAEEGREGGAVWESFNFKCLPFLLMVIAVSEKCPGRRLLVIIGNCFAKREARERVR